jgi:hypothetical protein
VQHPDEHRPKRPILLAIDQERAGWARSGRGGKVGGLSTRTSPWGEGHGACVGGFVERDEWHGLIYVTPTIGE